MRSLANSHSHMGKNVWWENTVKKCWWFHVRNSNSFLNSFLLFFLNKLDNLRAYLFARLGKKIIPSIHCSNESSGSGTDYLCLTFYTLEGKILYLLFAVLWEISVKERAPKTKVRIVCLSCIYTTKVLILAGDGFGPLSSPEKFVDSTGFPEHTWVGASQMHTTHISGHVFSQCSRSILEQDRKQRHFTRNILSEKAEDLVLPRWAFNGHLSHD